MPALRPALLATPLTSLLCIALLAPGCRCNRDRDPAPVPGKVSPTAPGEASPPAAAVAPSAPATAAVVAQAATPIDTRPARPVEESPQLRGLDDAGWLLQRALADLRQRLARPTVPGEIGLNRLGGQGQRGVLLSLDEGFVAALSPAGAGLRFEARGAGCVLRAGPARSACPITEAASVRALAALAWLAWRAPAADLGLVVEAVHGAAAAQPVRLRLRARAVGDRWTLTVAPGSGHVAALGLEVEGRVAELRLPRQTGAGQGRGPMSLFLDGRVAAAWTLAPPAAADRAEERQLLLEAPITSLAEAEAAIGRLQVLAETLAGAATAPEALVGHWQGGKLRLTAVQVPVILPVGAAHPALRRLENDPGKTTAVPIANGDLAAALLAAAAPEGCHRMIVLGPPAGSASADQRNAVLALRPCADAPAP